MAKIYKDSHGFLDEWKKMKDKPLKTKAQYIIEYYGLWILIFVIAVVATVATVKQVRYNKIPNIIEAEFYTSVVSEEAGEELKEYIAEKLGVNPDDYHVAIISSAVDTSNYEQLATQWQMLVARINAKELDFLCADVSTFNPLMDKEEKDGNAFHDLRDILPEETLDRLDEEGRLVYYDSAEYSEPFPYLINIGGSELYDMLGIVAKNAYIGVPVTAPQIDSIVAMCDLITDSAK